MKITETLSVKITDIFIDNHVFPSRQRAAYIYCFDFCFDLFLYNLSLLILGIFFHHGWLALVYVFTMSPLKMLAGGMHASSRSICDIISYLTFCIGIIVTIYLPIPAIQISSLLVFLCIADCHHHPCTCGYKKPSPDSKEEMPIKMSDCSIFDNATKLVPYIF